MIKSSIAYNGITFGAFTSSNSVLISCTATRSEFTSALSDWGYIYHDSTADFAIYVSTSSTLGRSTSGIIYIFYGTTNVELFQTNLTTTFISGEVKQNGFHDLIIVIHGIACFCNVSTGFKILRETANNMIRLSLYRAEDINQNGVHNVFIIRTPYVSNTSPWFLTDHRVDNCMNNEDCIPWLQNSLYDDVQQSSTIMPPPSTMLDNSTPADTIFLEPNKKQTLFSFCLVILSVVIMILCNWLRPVQSDSSTGGACSSSALEILKRREKIRYVFQHYPSHFIEVSYLLSYLLC